MTGMSRIYASGEMDVRISGKWALLLRGDIKVEDLDDEEVARGRMRDRNGNFSGRPPKLIPRELLDRINSEHHRRVNEILEQSLGHMTKTMRDIAIDPDVDAATRLKAAIYVYERFFGKTPDKIEVRKGDRVDQLVSRILFEADEATPLENELAAAEAELEDTRTRRRPRSATRTRRTS